MCWRVLNVDNERTAKRYLRNLSSGSTSAKQRFLPVLLAEHTSPHRRIVCGRLFLREEASLSYVPKHSKSLLPVQVQSIRIFAKVG